MNCRCWPWITCLAAFCLAAPVGAQAVDPQALGVEIRGLRKEVQALRRDLARVRSESEASRKAAAEVESRLTGALDQQARELRAARDEGSALTVAVVILGVLSCAALGVALSRRPAQGSSELSAARSRIEALRAQLRADEARLAELRRRDAPPTA